MDENILDHLITEHDEMRQMMSTLEERYDQQKFKQLGQDLEKHQEAEEAVLYKRLMNEKSVHALVLEGIEEHHAAADLLHKLQRENGGTEVWTAKFKVLKEAVEHHLEEEEDHLFIQAQDIIPEQEAISLTEQFEKQKERVKTHA